MDDFHPSTVSTVSTGVFLKPKSLESINSTSFIRLQPPSTAQLNFYNSLKIKALQILNHFNRGVLVTRVYTFLKHISLLGTSPERAGARARAFLIGFAWLKAG